MARKLVEIQTNIKQRFMSDEVLMTAYGLSVGSSFDDSFSKVSIEKLTIDIIAFSIWVLETIFDTHKNEVEELLSKLIPGTARWYRNKALAFQYGFDLVEDSDVYDNSSEDEQLVEDSKIIKYAAIVEAEDQSRLIVKIATEQNDELVPIQPTELEAFKAYMEEIKYAGVRLTVINYLPDLLRLNLRIYRDPLLLDQNGVHRIIGNKPIEDALQEYMKELPFNGELVVQDLQDKLQSVDGVKIVQIDQVQTAWIDGSGISYGNFEAIDVKKIPVSGYFKIENYDNISYVV